MDMSVNDPHSFTKRMHAREGRCREAGHLSGRTVASAARGFVLEDLAARACVAEAPR